MSISPGEIIGADLSPNANILGTQIADKTLQLRNLSDDTFGIIRSGTLNVTQGAVTGTSGQYVTGVATVSTAHFLPFTPYILSFVSVNGAFLSTPYTLISSNGANAAYWITYRTYTDSTFAYFDIDLLAFGVVNLGSVSVTAKYYLLEESINT